MACSLCLLIIDHDKQLNYGLLKIIDNDGRLFIIMYSIMFHSVDDSHIYLRLSRTSMSLLMMLPMVIVTILFMGKIYLKKKLNTVLIVGSLVLFGIIL